MSVRPPAEPPYIDLSGCDNVYFFSDLEGSVPTMPHSAKSAVGGLETLLNTLNPIKTSLITFLAKNAIVFCGDLIDRGPQSIRMLKRMLELKKQKQSGDKVVLIAGNRDINKIRLFEEFAVEIPPSVKPHKSAEPSYSLQDLLNDNVKLTATRSLFEIMEKNKAWGALTADLENLFDINGSLKDNITFKEYVDFIFKKTMGCGDYETFYTTEIKAILNITEDQKQIFEKNIHKYIVILWNVLLGKLNVTELKDFHGVYKNYIETTLPIAAIKTPDGNLAIASHAGIPFDDATKSFYLKNSFALQSNTSNSNVSVEMINKIQESYIAAVKSVFSALTSTQRHEENSGIRFLIMSSAHTSHDSPINASHIASDHGPRALELLNPEAYIDNTGFKTIYNVFGHQPVGLVPVVSRTGTRTRTGNTTQSTFMYHICLDISKAETLDYANENSFGCFVVQKSTSATLQGFVNYENIYTYNTSIVTTVEKYNGSDPVITEVIKKDQTYYVAAELWNPFKRPVILDKRPYWMTQKNTQQTNSVQPTSPRNLIITTGDTSDADGFIALAQYAKSGADVCFFINLPYVYNPKNNNGPKNPNNPNDPKEQKKNNFGLGYDGGKRIEAIDLVKMCIKKCSDIFEQNRPIRPVQTNIKFVWTYNSRELNDTNSFFYNSINPFAANILTNDLIVYKYTAQNTVNTTLHDKVFDLTRFNDYDNIYVDMNGSCAFVNETFINQMKSVTDKVRGLFVMGGVEIDKINRTLKSPLMNRVWYATMNQVYHPMGAKKMFDLFCELKKPIYIVSNNEVNDNGNLTKYNAFKNNSLFWPFLNTPMPHPLPDLLPNTLRKESPKKFPFGETLKDMMYKYYIKLGYKDCKLFDVLPANVLVKEMLKESSTAEQAIIKTEITSANATNNNLITIYENIHMVKYNHVWDVLEDLYNMNTANTTYKTKEMNMLYDDKYGTTVLLTNENDLNLTSPYTSLYEIHESAMKKEEARLIKTGNKPLIGDVKNSIVTYEDVKNELEQAPQSVAGAAKRSKNYSKMLLKDLQAIAKARKISYSGLKKADLIAKLRMKKSSNKKK